MTQNFSERNWLILGLFISLGALGIALFLQISKEWFPCPLCILQRYAYLLTALGFAGAAFARHRALLFNPFLVLTALGCLAGLAVAFYHVWVLSNPLQTCGVDPLQFQLNALPWVPLWPDMFSADGLCSEQYPPLLGLSLPMWSAIGFVIQFVCLIKIRFFTRH